MSFAAWMALLVAIALGTALAMRLLRRPASAVAVEVAPREVREEEDVVEVVVALPAPESAITWTAELTAADLDLVARESLIDDLALLATPWSVALLRRAREEERAPRICARIDAALASSGEPVATTMQRNGG